MGIIIPIDCHILQKGFSSTKQIKISGFTTARSAAAENSAGEGGRMGWV
jgi:hypothetical protein